MSDSNLGIILKRRIVLLSAIIGVMLISSAEIKVQAKSNFHVQHDSDEPIFRDSPSSEDYAAVSLTDDSRFSMVEPSWELKFNPKSSNMPNSNSRERPKSKRNCGQPSVATRALLGSTIKRSDFAVSRSELESKLQDEEETRKKRETKRNGLISDDFWTCETKYEWLDMGVNHYPRFVKTASCESRRCANGLFQCHARKYKTKILKRVAPSDSPACDDDTDDSLPETLRSEWRLITVSITHCCDCSGRNPTSV